jgi:hypothetical protein
MEMRLSLIPRKKSSGGGGKMLYFSDAAAASRTSVTQSSRIFQMVCP